MKKREKNMSLYNDNIDFLKKNYPYVKWNTEQEVESNTHEICVMEDRNKDTMLGVMIDNHVWTFGSCYDAEMAAEYWVNQFENVNYRTIFILIGVGNGIYIRKLTEKYPENYVIVCEPDMELFAAYLETQMMKRDFSDKVFLAAGENAEAIYMELMYKLINYDNKKEIKHVVIPNYQNVNRQLVVFYKKKYRDCVERVVITRNTIIVDEETRAENQLRNMLYFYKQFSLGQLYDAVKGIEPKKHTAIVVAAGPSLDKNIAELKKAQNKAFIMVVDTALKTVIKAGIKPDLAIMIDPEKDPQLFQKEEIRDLPLCVSICGNHKIIEAHKGELFFPTGETKMTEALMKKYEKGIYTVPTGGSVANNAFSIVGLMGFGTIILVGQDLAYPNGQIHTSAAYDDEQNIEISDSKYFQVEDIYGGKVYTEANMDCYRKWYEEQININPQIRVIDATEGGAKIRGTEIMTLREAIALTCDGKENLDYKNLIKPTKTMFNREQQTEIEQYFINVEFKLENLKKLLKEQKENYNQLEKIEMKNQQMGEKYKKLVKKTAKNTKKIEENELMDFLQLYKNIVEYRVIDNLNDNRDKNLSESIKAARGGKMLCETYMENIETVKAKWHELLIENHLIEE